MRCAPWSDNPCSFPVSVRSAHQYGKVPFSAAPATAVEPAPNMAATRKQSRHHACLQAPCNASTESTAQARSRTSPSDCQTRWLTTPQRQIWGLGFLGTISSEFTVKEIRFVG